MDLFFARKKNPEVIILPDFEIKADVLANTGATADEILNAYLDGIKLDTTVDAKIGFLKKGIAYFKANKMRDKEGDLIQKLIDIKPKPTINDYFELTLARYFSANYSKSREIANTMIQKYPDQPYGYEWKFNSSSAVDTVKKDSIAVPDALELYSFAQKDTAKFRKLYLNSVKFLGAYYINQAKDKDKSLEFFTKWLEADPVNAATIQGYIDQIKKMPATKPASTSPNSNPAPKSASIKKPIKTKITGTTKQVVS